MMLKGFFGYYNKKRRLFKRQNRTYDKGQTIFIGDSITDMCNLDKYYGGLPLKVYNRGISGDVTQGVIDRLDVSLYALAPSVVVILIGINDVNNDGRDKNYILANYEIILDEIKKNLPKSKVIIQSIYPVNDDVHNIAKNTGVIISVNEGLKVLADKYGYVYADIFGELEDGNNRLLSAYATDGLHLNERGYEVVSKKLKGRLYKVINE
ncbi:MAG: GDSL-type esterase/lipase family protein [Clostridiales bacterium]|jgi:lysophospholipase L1-like esterase|nr:GDSL-type esterase/lipase family protein [Clostridiales bacterium]